MKITEEAFVEEIAPARTFGFLKEVEMLRQRGLALGGSLDNAIVLGETGVLNNALRFEDEFVRHKILDVIGDLSLVGFPVIGHLVAHRGGHALHTSFAARILEEVDAWRVVEATADPAQPAGRRVDAREERGPSRELSSACAARRLLLIRPSSRRRRAARFRTTRYSGTSSRRGTAAARRRSSAR